MGKLIDSPAWRELREQEARHPSPRHHIRDDEDEAEIVADRDDGLHSQSDAEQVQDWIRQMRRPLPTGSSDDGNGKRRPWTKSEVFGLIALILTTSGSVVGLVAWAVTQGNGVYAAISASKEATDKQIAADRRDTDDQFKSVAQTMVQLQDSMKMLAQNQDQDQKATLDRTSKYIPQIETTAGKEALLEDRVKAIAESISDLREVESKAGADMRNAIQDLTKTVGMVNTDVQVLKAQGAMRAPLKDGPR